MGSGTDGGLVFMRVASRGSVMRNKGDLIKSIRESDSYRFVADPRQFLDDMDSSRRC